MSDTPHELVHGLPRLYLELRKLEINRRDIHDLMCVTDLPEGVTRMQEVTDKFVSNPWVELHFHLSDTELIVIRATLSETIPIGETIPIVTRHIKYGKELDSNKYIAPSVPSLHEGFRAASKLHYAMIQITKRVRADYNDLKNIVTVMEALYHLREAELCTLANKKD